VVIVVAAWMGQHSGLEKESDDERRRRASESGLFRIHHEPSRVDFDQLKEQLRQLSAGAD
jgi:hypothetical protein